MQGCLLSSHFEQGCSRGGKHCRAWGCALAMLSTTKKRNSLSTIRVTNSLFVFTEILLINFIPFIQIKMLFSFILMMTVTRVMCSSRGDSLYIPVFPPLFNWHTKISPSSSDITLNVAKKIGYQKLRYTALPMSKNLTSS